MREEGQHAARLAHVPVVESACGDIARRGHARDSAGLHRRAAPTSRDADALERKLYVIRKRVDQ